MNIKKVRFRHKIHLIMCVFLCLVSVGSSILGTDGEVFAKTDKWPSGPDPFSLRAESACLMDLKTGQVLYNKNMNRRQYPASITKVMTSLLAVENCSLGEMVHFSSDAVYGIEPGSAHIACEVDEELTVEQCLYGMMLSSANEVCLAIAEHVSGSKEAFAKLMNEKAKELGCKNTHFTNPNGLHESEHYTSAYDMCLIARGAWQYEDFRKVTGTKYYTMAKTNKKKEERYLLNNHQMLYGWKIPGYEYEYCVGGKTGFTDQSLNTLVTYAKKGDIELVAVVMRDCSPLNSAAMNEYTDTKAMMEFGFSEFVWYDMSAQSSEGQAGLEDDIMFNRYCSVFSNEESPIYIGEGGGVLLPKNLDISKVKKNIRYDVSEENSGQKSENARRIGTVEYTYGKRLVGSTDIYYRKIEQATLETAKGVSQVKEKKLEKIVEQEANRPYWIVGAAAGVIVLLVAGYIFFIKRRRESEFAYYRNRGKKNKR